jgi:nucleotide-binding universal stress UspA family protein
MKTLDARTQVQLKNVLFATDFSAASKAALPYAAGIARRYETKLLAVHVRPYDLYANVPPDAWRMLSETAKAQAKEQIQRLLQAFDGIEREVLIGEGEPWEILSKVIEKNEIGLIVLGTRGRTGIGKLLLGSVAETIFRQAPCPVLTVGPHSKESAKKAGEFHEILYATDFTAQSKAAAAYAISLAQEHQAHLTLLHVVANPKTGELVHPEQLVTSKVRMLHNLVPSEAELWCQPEYVVEQGEAATKILEVAKERDIDLIVLGVHRPKGYVGAVTHLPMATAHRIVSQAACPVLTVRG